MTVPPSPPVIESLARSTIRVDVLMRIAWRDGRVSRLTSAFDGLNLPADAVETEDGARYSPLPAIRQIPALRQLVNGQSDSAEFELSGLPSDIRDIAESEADAELGEDAEIRVGKVYWDEGWSIELVRWNWFALGGAISTRRNGGAASGGVLSASTFTVALETGTQQIRRAGADLSLWTPAQHERDRPGDLFFRQINKLNPGYNKPFPKF